ncbi:MAG: hypothetical protein ACRD2Z_16385 [Thermoanaerobaculia bacterium]
MRTRFSYVATLLVGLALCGCVVHDQQPGPRSFELSHRPIYLWLDESGDKPMIDLFPRSATTHWTRDPGRIVWMVDGKRPEDEWIINWKGPDTGSGFNYWPGEKRIPRGTDEAFYTAPPVGDPPKGEDRQEATAERRYGRGTSEAVWVYSIRVERRMPDGTVQTIAELDPEVIIRHP